MLSSSFANLSSIVGWSNKHFVSLRPDANFSKKSTNICLKSTDFSKGNSLSSGRQPCPSASFTLTGCEDAFANGNTKFWKPFANGSAGFTVSVHSSLLLAHNAFGNRHLWWKCGKKVNKKEKKDDKTHIVLKGSILSVAVPALHVWLGVLCSNRWLTTCYVSSIQANTEDKEKTKDPSAFKHTVWWRREAGRSAL